MERDAKLLIVSFVLLNLLNWITTVELQYSIPLILKYLLSAGVLGLMIWFWLKHRNKPNPGSNYSLIINLFVIWSSILVIFAIVNFNDLFYLQRVFAQRFFFIPYILPLIILFTKFDIKFFKVYLHFAALLIIPALLLQLFIIISGMDTSSWFEQTTRIFIFDIGSSLVLLTAHLYSKKYVSYFIIVYFILFIFLWSFFGRRGMIIEYTLIFLMMLIMRLKSPLLKRSDRMKIYFLGIVLLLLLIGFGYLFSHTYAFQRGFSISAFEESRGQVLIDFFNDFNSIQDWLIGRGLLGTVSRSILGYEEAGFIENGFLNILLKGGLIYALPFILIMLRASYIGFFRTNNELTKALALIILVHIIMMAYFNLPDYSPKYILTWIAVSACYNTELRNATTAEILEAINRN